MLEYIEKRKFMFAKFLIVFLSLFIISCQIKSIEPRKVVIIKVTSLMPVWNSNYETWETSFRTLDGMPGSIYGYIGKEGDTVVIQKVVYSNGYYKWAINRK